MSRTTAFCLLFVPAVLAAAPPKFGGLGTHSRKVTEHKDAQGYFDQGLAFLYAFNHDEAIRSFEHAAKLDPDCPMAHWGVALACGGHINKPNMDPATMKMAVAAMTRTERHANRAGEADLALIAAVVVRYTEKDGEDQERGTRPTRGR